MNQCPKCGEPQKDPFGIVQCSKCKSMLVADFEGNLKLSEDNGINPLEIPEAPFTHAVGGFEVSDANLSNSPDGLDMIAPVNPEPQIEHTISKLTPKEKTISKIALEPTPAPEPSFQQNPIEELSSFANSEKAEAPEGLLLYTIEIKGLDTVELKNSVKIILEDPKLKINSAKLITNIKNGNLTIPNLNPVKASMIVSQLKTLPLQINWNQMTIFDSTITGKEV